MPAISPGKTQIDKAKSILRAKGRKASTSAARTLAGRRMRRDIGGGLSKGYDWAGDGRGANDKNAPRVSQSPFTGMPKPKRKVVVTPKTDAQRAREAQAVKERGATAGTRKRTRTLNVPAQGSIRGLGVNPIPKKKTFTAGNRVSGSPLRRVEAEAIRRTSPGIADAVIRDLERYRHRAQ